MRAGSRSWGRRCSGRLREACRFTRATLIRGWRTILMTRSITSSSARRLQEVRKPLKVMKEMMRVGRRAIVAFPNFGHWSVRLAHLWSGRAPRTKLFPYDWYDSPNIHFLTVHDFESLAGKMQWPVERAIYLSGDSEVKLFPNLMAEVGVFLIRK